VVVNVVQKYGSRLVLLSVVETPEEASPSDAPMASPVAVEQLLKMPNLCSLQGIQAEIIEREGKPALQFVMSPMKLRQT
jgi:hypothetical protein